jgi:hypothetical protein
MIYGAKPVFVTTAVFTPTHLRKFNGEINSGIFLGNKIVEKG